MSGTLVPSWISCLHLSHLTDEVLSIFHSCYEIAPKPSLRPDFPDWTPNFPDRTSQTFLTGQPIYTRPQTSLSTTGKTLVSIFPTWTPGLCCIGPARLSSLPAMTSPHIWHSSLPLGPQESIPSSCTGDMAPAFSTIQYMCYHFPSLFSYETILYSLDMSWSCLSSLCAQKAHYMLGFLISTARAALFSWPLSPTWHSASQPGGMQDWWLSSLSPDEPLEVQKGKGMFRKWPVLSHWYVFIKRFRFCSENGWVREQFSISPCSASNKLRVSLPIQMELLRLPAHKTVPFACLFLNPTLTARYYFIGIPDTEISRGKNFPRTSLILSVSQNFPSHLNPVTQVQVIVGKGWEKHLITPLSWMQCSALKCSWPWLPIFLGWLIKTGLSASGSWREGFSFPVTHMGLVQMPTTVHFLGERR